MQTQLNPRCRAAWIGSLPLEDHAQAVKLMMRYTPDIPLWIQLPHFQSESMIAQFLPGMPGLQKEGDRQFIQNDTALFDDEILTFFEACMAVMEDPSRLPESRFALTPESAPGFFVFTQALDECDQAPFAVKAQVTGPFTFATGITDQKGKAIFYDAQLRDVAIKNIALKARWQVQQLKKYNVPVIVFLDEPGLAGFGSSAFISVSRQDISDCLEEVMTAIHDDGGLTGVHVCANAEWPVILDSSADIVSFDAYSFFDKFILYPEQIKKFIEKGGIIAWGIVPTGDIASVEKENVASLFALWENQIQTMGTMGIDRNRLLDQSLITPSCGTGSLPLATAEKVIQMTQELSAKIRKKR